MRFAIATVMLAVALVALVACTLWVLSGLWAVLRVTRAGRENERPFELDGAPREPPAVTLLKPLCGADAGLEENLTSFFRLSYPNYELIFGVAAENDPSLAVVARLQARYPRVIARAVVHPGSGALNPKVENLSGILPLAPHDLVVV